MVKCLNCLKDATWVCCCSDTYLYKDHAGKHFVNHFEQNTNPNLVKLKFTRQDPENELLKLEIKRRIFYFKDYKQKI